MYQQHEWQIFELTMRCHQGRFLLRPGEEANRRLIGVLARSQRLYGEHIRLHLLAGTSNHLHIVLAARSATWKAHFKSHFKTNVSKELGDLYDWRNSHWERRTRDIPILDDQALKDRLMYLSAHNVKDGLIENLESWPGVRWTQPLTEGVPLKGVWYDRTTLHKLRLRWEHAPKGKRGLRPVLADVAEDCTVEFTPPPMWEGLSPVELRAKWQQLIAEALKRHPAPHPSKAMSPKEVLGQSPHSKPKGSKWSPAPWVHTTQTELRKAWKVAYTLFCEVWRATTSILIERLAAELPSEGCCPPWLPLEERAVRSP